MIRSVCSKGLVCMRDLGSGLFQCFFVKDYKRRTRWDCGLVIRSRGRWGKCG